MNIHILMEQKDGEDAKCMRAFTNKKSAIKYKNNNKIRGYIDTIYLDEEESEDLKLTSLTNAVNNQIVKNSNPIRQYGDDTTNEHVTKMVCSVTENFLNKIIDTAFVNRAKR